MNTEYQKRLEQVLSRAREITMRVESLESDLDRMESIGYTDGRTWTVPRHWDAAFNEQCKNAIKTLIQQRIDILKAEYDELQVPPQ